MKNTRTLKQIVKELKSFRDDLESNNIQDIHTKDGEGEYHPDEYLDKLIGRLERWIDEQK